jgi:hypothetical protein
MQNRKHSLGADLQKTPTCITSSIVVWRHGARVSCARSIATVRARTIENIAPVLLAAYVLRALLSNGSKCKTLFQKCCMCFGQIWQNSTGHFFVGFRHVKTCVGSSPSQLFFPLYPQKEDNWDYKNNWIVTTIWSWHYRDCWCGRKKTHINLCCC